MPGKLNFFFSDAPSSDESFFLTQPHSYKLDDILEAGSLAIFSKIEAKCKNTCLEWCSQIECVTDGYGLRAIPMLSVAQTVPCFASCPSISLQRIQQLWASFAYPRFRAGDAAPVSGAYVDSSQLRSLEPSLSHSLYGGVLFPACATANPAKAMQAFAAEASASAARRNTAFTHSHTAQRTLHTCHRRRQETLASRSLRTVKFVPTHS